MSTKNNATPTGAAAPDRQLIVSRVLDAPRELVWEAMTDPLHVVNWWGPRGFTTTIKEMDVRPGGVWTHVMRGPDGAEYPNASVFKEVKRPERIVFAHGGEKKGGSAVHFVSTWTFEAVAAGRTKVTVSMEFPSAAERDRVVAEFGALEGAKQTLERLSEFLPGLAACGDFVISRLFDAPRDLVFRAWMQPERMARWFGPKGCTVRVASFEGRPGGVALFSMRMADGREMWGKWVFREVTAPSRIVFVNSFSDAKGGLTRHPANANWPLEMLTTTTLEDAGGKTKLTVRWTPVNPTPDERNAFDAGRQSMVLGWTGTFDQLEAYLAARGEP